MKIFHFHLLLCPNQPPCRLKCNHFMKFLFLLCNNFILFPYRLTIDIDEQKTLFSLSFCYSTQLVTERIYSTISLLGQCLHLSLLVLTIITIMIIDHLQQPYNLYQGKSFHPFMRHLTKWKMTLLMREGQMVRWCRKQ